MGSDHAPEAEIAGVIQAVREEEISVVLVGDEARLRALLQATAQAPCDSRNVARDVAAAIEVRHAPEVITMDDAPSIAVKQKKQSSMRVCFDLLRARVVDAVVSAGNSGAAMACGLFVLGRLPGIDRPAIVTSFPSMRGPCALLDMGANVDTKASILAQFAVMGAVYARIQNRRARPRVGLLSNGAEEHKGTALTRDTHRLLTRASRDPGRSDFDYIGYVEGRDIFKGEADVVVTDGFTGNVLLKGCEGLVEAVFHMARTEVESSGAWVKLGARLMRPAFQRLKKRIDYAETGGAPLLGVDGVVMICHGGSDARAIKNAILSARRFARSSLGQEIQVAIERHGFVWADPVTPGPSKEFPA